MDITCINMLIKWHSLQASRLTKNFGQFFKLEKLPNDPLSKSTLKYLLTGETSSRYLGSSNQAVNNIRIKDIYSSEKGSCLSD